MSTTIPCKLGMNCFYFFSPSGCYYNHDGMTACPTGNGCKAENCKKVHKKDIACCYAESCFFIENCEWKHENEAKYADLKKDLKTIKRQINAVTSDLMIIGNDLPDCILAEMRAELSTLEKESAEIERLLSTKKEKKC